MNKSYLVTFLALMTAISGITYYTLSDKEVMLRGGNGIVPTTGEIYTEWLKWCTTYQKQYNHDEAALKFQTFKNNYVYIKKQNALKKSYKVGVNQFMDLTNDEFKTINSNELIRNKKSYNPVTLAEKDQTPIDWRSKGAVTEVKNQGQCGSCWAFSTTGSLEGLNFQNTGKLLSFSEQQLVDCSTSFGNQGCNGGLMDDAFQYVEKNGITTEANYPYTGQDGTCSYTAKENAFENKAYVDVPQNQSAQLYSALAIRPVSIAIEADSLNFQFYTSGVFDDTGCGINLDHGVLVVGYGVSSGQPYWIVKNSWAASWGNEGYIWIADVTSPAQGICGINMQPSYPTG